MIRPYLVVSFQVCASCCPEDLTQVAIRVDESMVQLAWLILIAKILLDDRPRRSQVLHTHARAHAGNHGDVGLARVLARHGLRQHHAAQGGKKK